ncbi:MAG: hypothetical protein AAGM67_20305, partial [Bacteroidota bacterium]
EKYKPTNPILFTQAKRALDVVEYAEEYRRLASYLLDKVYIVNEEADIPEDVPEGQIFITRAGNLSRRQFTLHGGSLGLFEGKRLGRAKNLEKLDKDIKKLQKQLTSEKVELDKAARKLDGLKREDFGAQLEPIRKEYNAKERDLSVLQSREKEHREFLERVGKRTGDLVVELEGLQKDIVEIDPQLKLQYESMQQLTSQLASQRGESQDLGFQLDEATQSYNQEHIRLIHIKNQFENIEREIDQKQNEIERYAQTNQQLREEMEGVRKDTDELISSNLQDDDVIVHLYQEKKEKEDRVGRMEEKVGMTKNSI